MSRHKRESFVGDSSSSRRMDELGICSIFHFPKRQSGVVAKSLDSGARGKGFKFWLSVHLG